MSLNTDGECVCVCRACGQSVPGRVCCGHPHHISPEHGHAAQYVCHKRVPLHHATRPTVNASQECTRLQSSAHCSRRERQPHACKCHKSAFLLPGPIQHDFGTCQLSNVGLCINGFEPCSQPLVWLTLSIEYCACNLHDISMLSSDVDLPVMLQSAWSEVLRCVSRWELLQQLHSGGPTDALLFSPPPAESPASNPLMKLRDRLLMRSPAPAKHFGGQPSLQHLMF